MVKGNITLIKESSILKHYKVFKNTSISKRNVLSY